MKLISLYIENFGGLHRYALDFESGLTVIREENGFTVTTAQGEFHGRMLVNAAGMYSDKISAMAGVPGYRIYPCRGEYLILDKIAATKLDIPVYPAPAAGIGGLFGFSCGCFLCCSFAACLPAVCGDEKLQCFYAGFYSGRSVFRHILVKTCLFAFLIPDHMETAAAANTQCRRNHI